MVPRHVMRCLAGCVAAIGVLLLAPAIRADDLFPDALVRFTDDPKQPVFTGAGPGHWDARIRERGWILREGNEYRMWYTGLEHDGSPLLKLGYARSPDGIHWTRYERNPIYSEHWVEDMMVVRHNGTYYMFAEGKDDQAQLLTSTDGIIWQRAGQLDVRQANGTPIEPGPYGTPTAWWEDDVWHLFYERRDLGIWLATSKDLRTWTNVRDEPVIPLGPDAYDSEQVALNQIIKHGGRYYAYYHGAGAPQPDTKKRLWCTCVAASTDRIHWQKYARNPLFPLTENKSSGILVHDGQRFVLYTMHDEVRRHVPVP
ncbi:MAG: glycosylase [Planctomycetes bacterium]|nr:glycosylase [Planctomycetota bacterium]